MGLDLKRLVLIQSFPDKQSGAEYLIGTGYLITKDLVLTARHVLGEGIPKQLRVRVEELKNKDETHFRDAAAQPVWENQKLDAVLIKVKESLDGIEPPEWFLDDPLSSCINYSLYRTVRGVSAAYQNTDSRSLFNKLRIYLCAIHVS